MAKYAINQEGIDSLKDLKTQLLQAINDTYEATVRLQNEVSAIQDDLGIYYDMIRAENHKVLLLLKKELSSDDGVGYLTNFMIPMMISQMEKLITAGLGDSDDEPKVLTLKRQSPTRHL